MKIRMVLIAGFVVLTASAQAADRNTTVLGDHLQAIRAAQRKGDAAKADELTRALLPSEAEIAAVLRPDVTTADLYKILSMHRELAAAPKGQLGGLFKAAPENTEVQVHAATTEEIAKHEKGSAAFNEFPGASYELASSHLKPGVRFYEAEFLKPGAQQGVKYHLFFGAGGGFRMLGPIWRALGKK